jgi:hypothetical protein
MLEPTEKELGELLEAARPAPALPEGWEARAVEGMAAVAGGAERRRALPARRVVYVSVALAALAVAAVTVVPSHRGRRDARSLLMQAAQAMEAASSVHWVIRPTDTSRSDSPFRMRMSPGRVDVWASPRAWAITWMSADGTVTSSAGANLDTGEKWSFSARRDGNMYLADLRPLGPEAEETEGRKAWEWLADYLGAEVAWEDETASVVTEVRGGREVTILTRRLSDDPTGLQDVYELDAASGLILSFHRYARLPDGREEVVGEAETIEYGASVPTDLRPDVGTVVPATVTVEETETGRSLVMSADGKEITRTDVPR